MVVVLFKVLIPFPISNFIKFLLRGKIKLSRGAVWIFLGLQIIIAEFVLVFKFSIMLLGLNITPCEGNWITGILNCLPCMGNTFFALHMMELLLQVESSRQFIILSHQLLKVLSCIQHLDECDSFMN